MSFLGVFLSLGFVLDVFLVLVLRVILYFFSGCGHSVCLGHAQGLVLVSVLENGLCWLQFFWSGFWILCGMILNYGLCFDVDLSLGLHLGLGLCLGHGQRLYVFLSWFGLSPGLSFDMVLLLVQPSYSS